MAWSPARDYFERARAWAVMVMVAAGAVAAIGSALDWVTITARPELREGVDFDNRVAPPRVTEPFTGLEAGDRWWSLAGGVGLLLSGVALGITKRSTWAWTGLLGAVLIGAVATSDYRGIGDLSSSISHRMDIVGAAEPGLGITLVVGAALAGLLGSVLGIAASPAPQHSSA